MKKNKEENRVVALQQRIRKLQDELQKVDDRRVAKKNKKVLGKFFRVRNSYSCPQSEADYWYEYVMPIRQASSMLYGLKFSTDSHGEITICPDTHISHIFTKAEGEISKEQFNLAWCDCLVAIGKAGLKVKSNPKS